MYTKEVKTSVTHNPKQVYMQVQSLLQLYWSLKDSKNLEDVLFSPWANQFY